MADRVGEQVMLLVDRDDSCCWCRSGVWKMGRESGQGDRAESLASGWQQ